MRFLLLLPSLTALAVLHAQAPTRPFKGPAVFIDDAARGPHVPARVQDLRIAVRIVGSVATTTWDLTIANPQDRVLEGELVFPLGPGQTVSRFALDMGGHLREGVVVDKAKGRQAFEEIERRGVDPGLLEMTAGNAFRARVYPIPARGTRRIVLACDQELGLEPRGLRYRLPLELPQAVGHFAMKVEVLEQGQAPALESSPVEGLTWTSASRAFLAETSREDFLPERPLELLVPRPADATGVFVERRDGESTFYVALNPEAPRRSKALPRRLVVAWDASGSAAARDRKQELALLEAYLTRIGACTVQLVVFRNEAEAPRTFAITGGDAAALREAILAAPMDGATGLGSLDLAGLAADEVLLFSDGLGTLGRGDPRLPGAPLTTLSSAQTADPLRLKALAEGHGGEFLDLSTLKADQALEALVTRPLSFLRATYREGTVSEVYPSGGSVVRGSFGLAGRLLAPDASLTLHFGYGGQETLTRTVHLREGSEAPVTRLWAQKKLAELMVDPRRNAAAIRELGRAHTLVTPETSLIVLDTVEDYARYRIPPPRELLATYERIVALDDQHKDQVRKDVLDQVRRQFQERESWWHTEFKPGLVVKARPQPERARRDSYGPGPVGAGTGPSTGMAIAGGAVQYEARQEMAVPPPPPTPTQSVGVQLDLAPEVSPKALPQENLSRAYAAPLARMARTQTSPATRTPSPLDQDDRAAAISLKTWDRAQPYLRALEAVPADLRYSVYLKLRPDYATSPGFYLDCAERFQRDGDRSLALRILSSLAELKLEDAALLRVLGHRLRQLEQRTLAVWVFEEVARIREEEPQSQRDLALACAEAGQAQRALDLLWKVVSTRWDPRFRDVNLIALGELNALVATSKAALNTAGIAPDLIRNFPVDVRVVLNWDTNDSDMDLHVVDPRGEECFYSHTATAIGGRISGDVTGGYGPEEFLLKKAVPGAYQVKVNYYGTRQQTVIGATTVNVELHLRYATGRQETRAITLRLTGDARMVEAGTFTFGDGKGTSLMTKP